MGRDVALQCGFANPPPRLGEVSDHALAFGVHNAEAELGLGIALLGKAFKFLERRFIVTTFVGGCASGEICTGRGRSEKQGQKGKEKNVLSSNAHFLVYPHV